MYINIVRSFFIVIAIYFYNFPAQAANEANGIAPETEKEDRCSIDWDNQSALKNFADIIYKTPETFVNQFTYTDSVIYISASAGLMFLFNRYDAGVQEKVEEEQMLGKRLHQGGDILGLATNIPFLQLGSYFFALKNRNEKMLNFSKELLTAHLLVNIETLIISNIPYHSRPNAERSGEQSFFERAFRGQSSFPSGHVAGISVLMFKGWEYYGYTVGVPSLAAMIYIGWARMESGDHYLSDIMGTVAMAGIASLATSRTYRSYFCPLDNLFLFPYFTGSLFGLSVGYDF